MYEELVKRLQIAAQLADHGLRIPPSLCLEAADAIESTNKAYQMISEAYEAEVTKQNWIPVKERLPEELAEVNIAWMNTAPAPYYDFIKDKTFTGSAVYYKGKWFWYSAVCRDYLSEYRFSPNDSMDDAIKVTHWMPMPEPPKEET